MQGELAFHSFVPRSLKELALNYSDSLVNRVVDAQLSLANLRNHYAALSKIQKQDFMNRQIEREAKASVELASKNAEDCSWLEKAIRYGWKRKEELPMSGRLFQEVHDYLLHAPHNYQQNPGEYRRSPNWLGKAGSVLKTANFVPPVPEDMQLALYELEHFIHGSVALNRLILIVLVHYQLEMIHPFLDGNGRLGRLVLLLQLGEAGLIPAPILPLSSALQEKVYDYYIGFTKIETMGDYEGWLSFMLERICRAVNMALDTAE